MFCYKSLHYILRVLDVRNENHELTNTDIQYLTMADISDTKFIYIKRTGHFNNGITTYKYIIKRLQPPTNESWKGY